MDRVTDPEVVGGRQFSEYSLEPGAVGLMVVDLLYCDAWPDTPGDLRLRSEGIDTSYYNSRMVGTVVPAVAGLADTVRSTGGPGLWVKPEVMLDGGRDWARGMRGPITSLGPCRPGERGYELIPGLDADPADYIVPKKGVSAFFGGNAGTILRQCGVKHLLVTGCVTNYGVMVNVVDAANNNFEVTMVEDGCAAFSQAIHDASLVLHPGMYAVSPSAEIIASLS